MATTSSYLSIKQAKFIFVLLYSISEVKIHRKCQKWNQVFLPQLNSKALTLAFSISQDEEIYQMLVCVNI